MTRKVTIPTRYGFNMTFSGQALWLVSTCGACWYNNNGKCPVHGHVRKVWDERQACWKFEEKGEPIEHDTVSVA